MEKTERKTDRRVIKTKRAIRNALATLLTQKDYNDITIKDIADTADINRKTFYNYYRGVYQVVEEIENELVGKLDIIFGDINFKSYIEDPSDTLKKMNAVMNEDLEFYEHLFSIKDGTTLMQKVVDTLKQKTKENIWLRLSVDKEDTALKARQCWLEITSSYQGLRISQLLPNRSSL
jgi:AcrR family transcriptional regulator